MRREPLSVNRYKLSVISKINLSILCVLPKTRPHTSGS
jgi:hypothetical protein